MNNNRLLRRLALAGTCGCFLFLVVGVSSVRAQSSDAAAGWEEAAGGKLSFDAASVKRNVSGPQAGMTSNAFWGPDRKPPNGLLTGTNLPLAVYVAFAYKLDNVQMRTVLDQMPNWTRHTFYDIEARPVGTDLTRDQVRLMMQSLLADRFKLAVHFETKDGPAYALVSTKAGRLGSQMRSYPDGFPCSDVPRVTGGRGGPGAIVPTVDNGRFPASCGQIDSMTATEPGAIRQGGRDVSMHSIVDWIRNFANLDRPLIDRTGLSGMFDVSVESEVPLPSTGATGVAAPTERASTVAANFLAAVNDQLGLKLQSVTAPVATLIVDHVEQPSPN